MEYYNLTTPQKNIWSLQKFYEDTAISNICGAVFYHDVHDERLLEKAINQVIKKQTALRLCFIEMNGDTKQYVKEYSYVNFPVRKFTDEKEFESYAEKCASTPIGLLERDMYRFEIVHAGEKQGMLAVLSHLISDAWTFSLIVSEVEKAYQNLLTGNEDNKVCADYINYVQSEEDYFNLTKFEKDEAYWLEKYALKPESSPIKIKSATTDSIAARRLIKKMSIELSERIQNYCVENKMTEAVLFETVLNCYLYKVNPDNQTVTLGIPVLNRTKAWEKKTAGMFISTVPLTVEIAEEDTVSQLSQKITEAHVQIFRHQKYPYSMILEYLRKDQNFEGNLYDVMFSFQNARTDTDATTMWFGNGYSEVPFALHIDDRDANHVYQMTVDYQLKVFRDEKEVKYILDRIEYVLWQIIEGVDLLIKDISITTETEKQRILFEFNDTAVDYPRDKCVHELFMEQAARTPDEIAVVFEEKEITYQKLDEMSNVLAHILREKGVGCCDIVPIIAKRSWHILVAMLGILKAGAGYMPVSPDYPRDRVQFIINEAKSKVGCVLGYQENLDGIMLLNLDELSLEQTEAGQKSTVENWNTSEDVCYVIFTSGSTGVPKGIILSHKTLTNLICWQSESGVLKGSRRILSFTTAVFDVFSQEVFTAILSGLTLFLVSDEVKNNISSFRKYVSDVKADTLFCTPSYFDAVTKETGLVIQKVILAGEAFLLNENAQKNPTTYFNQYGPAETHVATCANISDCNNITIGHPIANTQIYILDRYNNPVPIGVPGELCIAGEGVGQGYLNRPDLTAERFVPNPFATEENGHGKTMYRTGDLAAWRDNGEIEYLGRIDTQVKIRGLRIELGEIESVMSQFPGIRMCAVADKKNAEGWQYLVGYYTTAMDEEVGEKSRLGERLNKAEEKAGEMREGEVNERQLRRYLSSKLPKYMVPNFFLHLPKLPMTPSGKLDRKNLPEPEYLSYDEETLKLPQSDLEEKILSIWKELLHMEKLGCDQDFFEVGGDSLLAIALLTQLEKEFDVHLQMKDIFANPTVEEQAAQISSQAADFGKEKILSVKSDRFLLTPQQRAVYLASQKSPETLLYNMPAFIPLPDEVDRDRLIKAIQEVFESFQILRMRVSREAEGLFGVIDHTCQLEVEYCKEIEKDAFVRPFDLQKAPLFRVGFTESHLLVDIHHVISDGTSLQILIKAVQATYAATGCLQEYSGYSDYAEYLEGFLKSEKAEQGLQWYREQLAAVSEAAVFPKVREQSVHEGASYCYSLNEALRKKETEICSRFQITETMLYMAAYALLVKSYTGLENVPGSIVIANRKHYETENTMGMFVNTLPTTWSFENKQTVEEFLRQCKDKMLKLYEYEEIPFETILEHTENIDAVWFNTSFVYQANAVESLRLGNQESVLEYADTHTAKFDLMAEVRPGEKGKLLRLEYRTDKIDRRLAERMAKSYESILLQLAEKEYVNEITALTKEEREKILYDFNDTKVDYPRDKCVHELFMEQAAKTPEEIAVVFEEKEITYQELDEMSNVLAHMLRDKGVKRGDIVPIIAKRSWHILVAMLGILKAGAGYMPVSPDYPKDRVQFIINEAKSKIGCVLGYKESLDGIVLLNLDELLLEQAEADLKLPVENWNTSEDMCYVIFTSGSTGVPKGVMVKHSNVSNYCDNNNNNVCHAIIKNEYKKIISVTNIVFDIFVTESLLPLLNGMTVYMTNEEEVVSQKAINRIVTENGVEVLQTTPTKMRGYLFDREQREYLSVIKTVILGGEVLTADLYEELRKDMEVDIFNIYGPAETTVWSTNACVKNTDITIGRPIANTQIYILDRYDNPVPIGVPGELCIAGEGVGLGYLNRPDLTAERFVPNPFATEENGHGKTMYRTGDLAAWRENGEIEYLGRIDTQVKIRGLRIELGEIESVMSQFPGIRMCAVTDKKDEEGRQYLAGYYITATDGKTNGNIMAALKINEKELRRYLSSKLPKYMVPNYFMHLPELPMTPSGKLDRKNLPVPKVKMAELTKYVQPVTELEKKLCRIMEGVLGYEPIGLQHDFFAYGGDSLKAMEFFVRAEEEQIRIKLQDIFDHPTVEEMVKSLSQDQWQESQNRWQENYDSEAFRKYEELLSRNQVCERYEQPECSVKTVLLSGITGFLGAHISDELLKDSDCIVYCLVRSRDSDDNRGRFPQILEYYFGDKYADVIGTRIFPVVGDITDEKLSDELPEKADMVIHAAATVKHYGSYKYFYKVNTLGTKHMADYALRIGARFVHISTISVSGNSLADSFETEIALEERHFAEDCLYQGQSLENVYVRSKFEAECVVLDAMLRGLQANIIRVGNLTSRSRDYVFQPNYTENAFLSRVKAVLELGCLPDYILPQYTEFSPVDDTADAIVRIAKHFNMQHTVFHVNSNRSLYFDRIMEILKELSVDMEVVDGETFTKRLKGTVSQDRAYIYEAFLNDMDSTGKINYETNIHIENEFTLSYLKQLGFEWPEIDYTYVKGYLKYFIGLGYLEMDL